MHRMVVGAIALLVLAVSVQGSQIEDVTTLVSGELTYQHDGGIEGDAPEECLQVDPARQLVIDGELTSGLLVLGDDERDVYNYSLGEELVGKRVAVNLATSLGMTLYNVSFDVRTPDCLYSVFDEDAPIYANPHYADPAPVDPVSPGEGEEEASARIPDPYDCGDSWKFLANQMHRYPAPETIFVEWSDGSWEYVPLAKDTPATIAMYETTTNPDVSLVRALAAVPEGYTGDFHLSHGFCGASEYQPPAPPLKSPTSGQFTVPFPGDYITVVTLEDVVLPEEDDVPTSVAVKCHDDFCAGSVDLIDYDLGSEQLT